MSDDEYNKSENTRNHNTSFADAYGGDSPHDLNEGSTETEAYTKPTPVITPVDDIGELPKMWYLQTLLREANADPEDDAENRTIEQEERIEKEFDRKVLEYAPLALRNAGLDLDEGNYPISRGYLLALLLKKVRKCSYEDLVDHLNEFPEICEELNINTNMNNTRDGGNLAGISSSTFSRRWNKLSKKERITNASIRIQYALYRRGIAFPEVVLENYENISPETPDGITLDPELKEQLELGKIPPEWKTEALRNWAELFLKDGILEPLSVERGQNELYPPVAFIGLLAHAALQHTSASTARFSCEEWVEPHGNVPSGGAVESYIKDNFSLQDLKIRFDEAIKSFLELSDEFNILADPKLMAFDPTDIPRYTEPYDDRWMKGYAESLKGNVESSDADYKWEFGLIAMIEGDIRFALGTYPIGNDVKAAHLTDLLLKPPLQKTELQMNKVFMDRELVGADFIKRLRGIVGNKWVMLAKQKNEVKELTEQTPVDEPRYYKLKNYPSKATKKPNLFVTPISEKESFTDESQRAFLTDLPEEYFLKPSSQNPPVYDPDKIQVHYRKRCRIETTIRQLKNDFHIPVQETANIKIKYFYMNLSLLFYNLHNLVNNAFSPTYSLPLAGVDTVTAKEVLTAIREVAFEIATEEDGN